MAFQKIYFVFNLYMCMYVLICGIHGGQEKILDPHEVEWPSMWILRIKLQSFDRLGNLLTPNAFISPASAHCFVGLSHCEGCERIVSIHFNSCHHAP